MSYRLTAAVAALALTFAVLAPSAFAGDKDKMGHQADRLTTALGLQGYSPVSYFTADQPHFGSPEFAAEYEGVTYFFADGQELSTFEANPEKFAPAYGGWCATGMTKEKYFDIDPTTYKIVDGQLFLFKKNPSVNALDIWNAGDEAELTEKANAFWASENAS